MSVSIPTIRLGELRDAEVEDLRMTAARHHDVLRLEVAMNDPAGVCAREPVGYRGEDLHDLSDISRRAGPVVERLPVDDLHREVMDGVGRSRIVNRNDGRMIERGCQLRLANKALDAGGVGGAKHFQRDHTAELHVAGGVHVRHTAGTEKALDAVAAHNHASRHVHPRDDTWTSMNS